MAENVDAYESAEQGMETAEPSVKAQDAALEDAETTVVGVVEDEEADYPTAEDGSVAEPSAAAQEAAL